MTIMASDTWLYLRSSPTLGDHEHTYITIYSTDWFFCTLYNGYLYLLINLQHTDSLPIVRYDIFSWIDLSSRIYFIRWVLKSLKIWAVFINFKILITLSQIHYIVFKNPTKLKWVLHSGNTELSRAPDEFLMGKRNV